LRNAIDRTDTRNMLSRKNKDLRTIKEGVVGKYVKKETPPEMPSMYQKFVSFYSSLSSFSLYPILVFVTWFVLCSWISTLYREWNKY